MVKRRLPVFGIAIGLLVLLGGAIYLKATLSSSGGGNNWGGMPPTPVVAHTVGHASFSQYVEALGTAHANESVSIMAKVTDTVRTIGFEDAEIVEEGHILIELMDVEETAGLAEARAGLDEAGKQFARTRELVANGTATASRLDTTRSDRDRARAKVQGLEAKLADRIIRAPFSGVLGLRQVSVGSLVRPGDMITTLDDVSIMKVDFSVSERYLARLKDGLQIEATNVAYPGKHFYGEVKSVDSRIDPVTRSIVVRAHIPNDDLLMRPGMLLSMTLIMNSREGLSVPEASLIPVKDDISVWVIGEDGTAQKRMVEVGMRFRGNVEILDGLAEGERVVVQGTSRIRRAGQKISTGEEAAPGKDGSGRPGGGKKKGKPDGERRGGHS